MPDHYVPTAAPGELAIPRKGETICGGTLTRHDRATSDPTRVSCRLCIIELADLSLWEVEIDEADDDYDRFQRCVVWARDPEHAEEVVRSAKRYPSPEHQRDPIFRDDMWIESPEWRLHVRPAPRVGIPLVHWHAG
jgi:hypothetical protein